MAWIGLDDHNHPFRVIWGDLGDLGHLSYLSYLSPFDHL
jgi:hypothetical protein